MLIIDFPRKYSVMHDGAKTFSVHTMTVHQHEGITVFVYRDINGRAHLLTHWPDGELTFSPNWHGSPCDFPLYSGPIDLRLFELAYSYLEYLDAAVEKEMQDGDNCGSA